ncbi:MAG: endopeptidase La [Lachnospiraceae bacterium]
MEYTRTMPILALRGKTVFPYTIIYFDVSRKKSIIALEEAMSNSQEIFLVSQRNAEIENPTEKDLYQIGTIALIKQIVKMPKGVIRVLAEGRSRGSLQEMYETEPSFRGEILSLEETKDVDSLEEEALIKTVRDVLELYVKDNLHMSDELFEDMMSTNKLKVLIDKIASNLPFKLEEKQEVLEEIDITLRCEKLLVIMKKGIEIFKIQREIQQKVKAAIDKNQRDYILREQIKAIRAELGEENIADEADDMRERAAKLKAPKEVLDKLDKEIKRFKITPNTTGESNVIREYIEFVLDMPWNRASRDNKDMKKAISILEAEHYGLKKVKERIIEYLVVRSMTKKADAPILCLVGPPGTGKTSIAQSVAKALNKKYARISLGGIRDEAEIRGHRKTYIGAMPGRIVEAIKQVKVKNPLILLDEIDKMSSDYKGDPASAMLEVLDGEQNIAFRDHYAELPIDLSEVLFIATANDATTIPKPLLDRMELIEVSSYTENEKFHIAVQYLIEKQKEKNGISKEKIVFTDDAIYEVIRNYTKEAGVRNLERRIGEVCRKLARKIFENKQEEELIIDKNAVKEILGLEPYGEDSIDLSDETGIVKGLAWTSVGGAILSIEVNTMPGKGKFELTGSLGDIMKESAHAGISYIRSIGGKYGILPEFFENHDIHIHIPEGAVPKDGPSAGITMATAMLSAILQKPIRGDIAMTGEITLRGKVLPIGGLREKVLAAKMAGVQEVLVPVQNKRNIEDLDDEIKEGIKITYVRTMEEVIERAFVCIQ